MSSESLYTTLGLAEDATQEQIRASYLRLLQVRWCNADMNVFLTMYVNIKQQYHPDKCTDENATLKTQQLVAAYTVLSGACPQCRSLRSNGVTALFTEQMSTSATFTMAIMKPNLTCHGSAMIARMRIAIILFL